MVGHFQGFIFSWHAYSNSVDKTTLENPQKFNPTKITNHTVAAVEYMNFSNCFEYSDFVTTH